MYTECAGVIQSQKTQKTRTRSIPIQSASIWKETSNIRKRISFKNQITQVQSKIGTCLYYARGVDPTILVALNKLEIEQSQPTSKTEKDLIKLFDYLATHPNATIRYVAGLMQLKVDSDALYLVVKGAKS